MRCLLLALSGHQKQTGRCPLLGVKRTSRISRPSFTLRVENCGAKNPPDPATRICFDRLLQERLAGGPALGAGGPGKRNPARGYYEPTIGSSLDGFVAGRRLRHAEHIGVHEQRGRVGQSANVDKLYVLRACSSVKGPVRLLRRARDRAERAEHAAVAFFGAQPRAALRAVIK
jgi:hypothetical protein